MTLTVDKIRCVVLNATYEPITVVSARRGLIMVFDNKASIIQSHPEIKIKSVSNEWEIPIQVVLNKMVKARPTFRTPAILTNRNLFIRDKYTCQYCSRHKSQLKSEEFMTRDHVYPQALGGKNNWENVVASCSTCNNKKGNRTLNDMGIVLTKKPYTPTIFEVWSKTGTKYLAEAKLNN